MKSKRVPPRWGQWGGRPMVGGIAAAALLCCLSCSAVRAEDTVPGVDSVALDTLPTNPVVNQPFDAKVTLKAGGKDVKATDLKNYVVQFVFDPAASASASAKTTDSQTFGITITKSGTVSIAARAKRKGQKEDFVLSPAQSVTAKLPDPAKVQDITATPQGVPLVGGTLRVQIALKGDDGNQIPVELFSKYSISVTSDKKDTIPDPSRESSTSDVWTAPVLKSGVVTLTIVAKRLQDDPGQTRTVAISADRVTRAIPLTINLDHVDEGSVRKNFGKKFADAFYVMQLRVKKIDAPGENDADRIKKLIIYPATIDVPVTFEKKWDPRSKSDVEHDPNDQQWHEVTLEDALREYTIAHLRGEGTKPSDGVLRRLNEEARLRYLEQSKGPSFSKESPLRAAIRYLLAQESYAATPADQEALKALLDANEIPAPKPASDDPKPYADGLEKLLEKKDIVAIDPKHLDQLYAFLQRSGANPQIFLATHFGYHPYAPDMLNNEAEWNADHSSRTKFFRFLRFAGTVASAVTSVHGMIANATTSSILDKYSNVLIPGLDQVWPDMSVRERRNLQAKVLHNLEPITDDSPVEGMLFFPKRPFKGLLRGYLTRIAEIHNSSISVRVAVVESEQTATSQ